MSDAPRREPRTDFSRDAERRDMAQAIASAAECLDQTYPLLIGAERRDLPPTFESRNPSNPGDVVGRLPAAGPREVEAALVAAQEGGARWQRTPPGERAAVLRRCAEAVRRRRLELSAWVCFEIGWTWEEADEEVASAVDFLELAALVAGREHGEPDVAGDGGIEVVIAPWKTPVAGLAATCAGALAQGRVVIANPACASSVLGWKLADAMREAGVPAPALSLLFGAGDVTGALLAADPRVGSVRSGGTAEEAAKLHAAGADMAAARTLVMTLDRPSAAVLGPGESAGGLEAAVDAVAQAAFGRAGQGCGACKRLIVHADRYGEVLERVAAAAAVRSAGPAIDFGTAIGPVIDAEARRRTEELAAAALAGGARLVAGTGRAAPGTQLLDPMVVTDVPVDAELWGRGASGPLLAVTPFRAPEEALALAGWIAPVAARSRPVEIAVPLVLLSDDPVAAAVRAAARSSGRRFGAPLEFPLAGRAGAPRGGLPESLAGALGDADRTWRGLAPRREA